MSAHLKRGMDPYFRTKIDLFTALWSPVVAGLGLVGLCRFYSLLSPTPLHLCSWLRRMALVGDERGGTDGDVRPEIWK